MKKLYAGLGISVAVIIFGVVITQKFTPKVDMTSLGSYYYNYNGKSEENIPLIKVISGDEKSLKFTVEFNNFNGKTSLFSIIDSSFYNLTSEKDKEIIGKYLTQKPDFNINTSDPKDFEEKPKFIGETVKYKWIKEPENMAISVGEKKQYKNKETGDYMEGEIYEPVVENNKIPKSGSLSLLKDKDGNKGYLFLNGIKGNGILELEINAIYAQEG